MMLLGSYPRLLVLALSLPEVSHALGLGNLRVDSKLNEPLSAQIDIIGATPEELRAISASVANRAIFERYNAERPAFLSSAVISVGTDTTGKPVLNIQSKDAFTEPLVEFLVDVRWGKQELVRDYSLLLDPARTAPALTGGVVPIPIDAPAPLVQLPTLDIPTIVLSSSAFDSTASAAIVIASNLAAANAEAQIRVVAHDTLRAIARHAGARSEVDQQRMMLAIFKANPEAFAGNINRLHEGALINIPSAAEIQVFDTADVEREIRAQMTAWRRVDRPASSRPAAPATASALQPAPVRAPSGHDPDVVAVVSAKNKLDGQVEFLQQTLGATTRQLESANKRIANLEQRGRQKQDVPAPGKVKLAAAKTAARGMPLSAMLSGMFALLVGGLALASKRFLSIRPPSRTAVRAEEPTVEVTVADLPTLTTTPRIIDVTEAYAVDESSPEAAARAPSAHHGALNEAGPADDGATVELTQAVDINVDTVEEPGPEGVNDPDTVVLVTLEPSGNDAPRTPLDYNLADLDGRAQHVEMPGNLHDRPVMVERRKNVVDTLMAAIKRDPTRDDLRMKLLETLYAAAATNLRAFKEVVRDLSRHPERIKADEWEQIMAMGRHIAADDALFAEPDAEQHIAKRA